MAYEKKDNYPSIKKPGVYTDGSIKELGLDNDDLENLSLGNWNSIIKSNKLLVSGEILDNLTSQKIEVKVRTSPPKNGTRVLVWRYKRSERDNGTYAEVRLAQGPIIEYLSDKEIWRDYKSADVDGVKGSRFRRTRFVYNKFYNTTNSDIKDHPGSSNDRDIGRTWFDYSTLKTDKVLTFEDGTGTISTDNGEDIILKLSTDSRGKLKNHVFERELSDKEINNWGGGAPESGNDRDFTHELIVLVEFDIQAKNLTEETVDSYRNTTFDFLPIDDISIPEPKYSFNPDRILNQSDFTEAFGEEANWDDYMEQYPKNSIDAITLRGLEYNLYTGPRQNAKDDIPFRASINRGEYNDNSEIGRELLLDSPYNGGYGYYRTDGDYKANITAIEFDNTYGVRPLLGTETDVRAFEWPEEFRFSISQTREIGNRDVEPERGISQQYTGIDASWQPLRGSGENYPRLIEEETVNLWDTHFNFLGYPNFSFNIAFDNPNFINNLNFQNVNFIVNVSTENGNDFIYYDSNNNKDKYLDTSYPVKVNLNISLLDYPDFKNYNIEPRPTSPPDGYDPTKNNFMTGTLSPQEQWRWNGQAFAWQAVETEEEISIDIIRSVFEATGDAQEFLFKEIFKLEQSFEDADIGRYKYEVIQWGDETVLLTDKEIEDTYFFNFYNLPEPPNINDFFYKKYQQSQRVKSRRIELNSNHIFNTPGVKSIKIVLYRYDFSGSLILQTYLITKNIVVNNGNLLSQDFEIFGGTDFNFLPIVKNQAIIGGFDRKSKYNNSVFKIVKDDNFIKDDYLEKESSKDYIKKINNNLLGKQPGQLDLGQVRVFKEARDIYDFIGGDKLNWIVSGSDTLPVNSLATDIFIRDNKCVVDLNPSDTEYSAIQNKAGSKEIGILIGDYKVNQPQGGRIQKQGVMKIPILDTDNEKQAF
jgi:hypothetical protein